MQTLTDTLAQLGYTHARDQHSKTCYAHEIRRESRTVFVGDAAQTWAWLRVTGQLDGGEYRVAAVYLKEPQCA